MKKILIILITACILGMVKAPDTAHGYNDGFQKRELSAYLSNIPLNAASKVKFLPAADGRGIIMQSTMGLTFKTVPVSEDIKYQLSFRARQEGLETLEENPRLAAAIFNIKSLHPYYQLVFFGENGKIAKGRSPVFAMPFGALHEYVHVFYPPQGARLMQLAIGIPSKDSTVYVSDMKLSQHVDDGVININPKFELGPYNYSGWKGFNEADGVHQLYAEADGKTVLFTGFTAFSESFPLKEPGTYRLYQKGSNHVRSNGTHLILLDDSGKEIGRIIRKLSRSAKDQKENLYGPRDDTFNFVLPRGSSRAHFWIYNTTIFDLSLTRVGDENAYQDLMTKSAK